MSITENTTSDYRLLVIDDEIEVTKSLFRQFRKKYDVYTATNGEEALELMETNDIQVIISDQRMPGMTGVDFFSRIKEKYPESLKLILTGYSDIEAVVGAINDGQVFRYITKPWIPKELDSIIKEAFDKYELITKNKKLMRSLEQANETLEEKVRVRTKELEELNVMKNKYIGIVAHDLRNPIGTAQSFSELLVEEYDELPKEEHLQFIKIINERCSFSIDLINDFLDIAKIESGTFDLNLSNQDYIEFIKKNIDQYYVLAKNKNQILDFKSTYAELLCTFDKNKLEQVCSNLISNAIKYSPQNTSISVEVFVENNMITTKVTDQGQGIPKDELDGIFNPFETTSVKGTYNEKSTGLGLAIVKKIIDAHHGQVKVESKVGFGSSFIFSFENNLQI